MCTGATEMLQLVHYCEEVEGGLREIVGKVAVQDSVGCGGTSLFCPFLHPTAWNMAIMANILDWMRVWVPEEQISGWPPCGLLHDQ